MDWRTAPATKKQKNRLKWWAAKLGRPVPPVHNKGEASDLIQQWEDDHPELEDAWQKQIDLIREEEEAKEEAETAILEIADVADEWREFYNCKHVPKTVIEQVVTVIGPRRTDEQINAFSDRLFAEIKKVRPDLFKQTPRAHRQASKGCLIAVLGLLLLLTTLLKVAATILPIIDNIFGK